VRKGAFLFSAEWTETIRHLGETGMGYTIVSVTLKDGRRFDQVVIDSGWLAGVRGLPDVPFRESDIAAIKATHEKWHWNEKPENSN
jgi:hypothetical protein